jgi:uncharacterized protein (TIGR03382 family)
MAGLLGLANPSDTTLAQTGTVPTNTQSLRFRAYFVGSSGSFNVTMDGVTLPLISLGASSNYIQYAADIHDWARLTAELAFTNIAQRPHSSNNYLFLDAIELSSLPAPEPGVAGLWSLGLLLLGWRFWRRRSSSSPRDRGLAGK